MGRPHKYPPEFRREAVDLVRSSDRPRAEIARSLGLHNGTLGNWVKAADEADRRSSGPSLLSRPELEELRRLRKEVVELRTDKEILKKAAAFFARETSRRPGTGSSMSTPIRSRWTACAGRSA